MDAPRANHHGRTFAAICVADNTLSVMGHARAVKGLREEAKDLDTDYVSRSMYSRTFER